MLRKWLVRISVAAMALIGFTYPVCALVCPRGIGSCPFPGMCFGYTDADGNSVCDYSSGTGTSGSQQAVTATSEGSTPSGLLGNIPGNSVVIGAVLCAAMTAALYWMFRSGRIAIPNTDRGPAFALSLLFSLGISEIIIYLLIGAAAYATMYALLYITAGTALVMYLWNERAMNRKVVLAVAGLSILAGFIFAAPIMPAEFTGFVGAVIRWQSLTPAILCIGAVMAFTLLSGRTFCAHLCPVGALQELAYTIPTRKVIAAKPNVLELVRLGIFAAAVIAALFAVDLLHYSGLYEFFALTVSLWSVAAAALMAVSVFLYRPVCRILCPFGVIFSVLAHFGLQKLQRTSSCTSCGKCEKACPAGVAGSSSSRRECYLCGRCIDACPADAIRYE